MRPKGNFKLSQPAAWGLVGLFLKLLASVCIAATYEAPLDSLPGAADPVKFAVKPEVTRAGDGVKIAFTLSAPTDVEVAILDAKGGVVRHLAAGLLGKNAPAPFVKDKLAQELLWDGKDDASRPVLGAAGPGNGPITVRVRAGARPMLERIVGRDNLTLGGIAGLAVSDKGEVYALLARGGGGSEVRVLDKDGKYLRTIMPYPANTPKERAESVGQITVDGERLPVVFNGHGANLHPLTSGMRKQNMAFNPKGFLVMASAYGTAEEHGPPRHLLALDPLGGAPAGMSFVGPRIRESRGFLGGAGDVDNHFEHLAASPDGKWTYFVPSFWTFHHAVFRIAWNDKGEGVEEGFVGQDYMAGNDDTHFNDPEGIAVDRDGNLYVCDRGNNRVMIFDPAGKLLGKIAIDNPEQIAVNLAIGNVYVACRDIRSVRRKTDVSNMSPEEYDAWKVRERERNARRAPVKPSVVVRMVSRQGDGKLVERGRLSIEVDLLAIDRTSDKYPTKLWASTKEGLVQIIDHGPNEKGEDYLEFAAPVTNGAGMFEPAFLAADPARNRILIRELSAGIKNGAKPIKCLDLATGKKTPFLEATEVALDRDGNIYGMGGYTSDVMYKFDPDGKPLPLAGSNSNRIETGPWEDYGPDLGLRGHCVDNKGNIYLIRSTKRGNGENGVGGRVDVFSPEGKKIRTAIDGIGHADCGLGVDAAGNIYLGSNLKPADQPIPKAFAGKVPAEQWLWWHDSERRGPWAWPYYNPYLYHWGSVLKFGPEGGAIYGNKLPWYRADQPSPAPSKFVFTSNAPADATTYRSGYLAQEVKVAGAQWRYGGVGIIPASDVNWGDPSCMCRTSRLAVDEFGRVFAPNVFRFSVEMLDTNGNQIARIGRYGNADDAAEELRWQAAKSAALRQPTMALMGRPGPEEAHIPFAWPAFCSTADGKLYVADGVNRQVLIIGFTYAAADTAVVPK